MRNHAQGRGEVRSIPRIHAEGSDPVMRDDAQGVLPWLRS
jgi:hypothetical protein